MTTEQRREAIKEACDAAGCSDKVRKIHFAQYVRGYWEPHPPRAFNIWWAKQPEATFIESKRAWNCGAFREQFKGTVSALKAEGNIEKAEGNK